MIPKKGSVTWIPLNPDFTSHEEFKGVEVGVLHVGPRKAREWMFEAQRLKIEEAKRKKQVGDVLGPNELTVEGAQATFAMVDKVLTEGIKDVRGTDSGKEILEYLDPEALVHLMQAVIEAQNLKPEQNFPSANSGDVGS